MVILTDLSEVLCRGVYGTDRLVRKAYGKKMSEQFLNRYDEVEAEFIELMRGHLTEDEFWDIFFKEDIWPFGAEATKSWISANFADRMPNALSVYRRIAEYPDYISSSSTRRKGRPEIWIVSDHIAERKAELEAIHPEIFKLVSKCIWSYDYGLIKRDRGFFHRLLRENKLEPDEAIFIDDQLANIWSAQSAGIEGISFFGPVQLERDLRSYGFRFNSPVQRNPNPNAS